MRIASKLLLASLVLAGLLGRAAAGQSSWYYHVKTGGTGGKLVQNETDPGLSSCWNSINAAFAAVKSRATPGPWIIQVDDEATYDEAVILTGFQTSSTETLTLTKAPWLAGRPTIYPRQLCRSALAINGLWRGAVDTLPGQPGQTSRRVTYVTVRGFTLKNNAFGTDKTTELSVFSDHQAYLTEGLHIIEDCLFDGQNQVFDSRNAILIFGTCIMDGVLQRLGEPSNPLQVGQQLAAGTLVARVANPAKLKAAIKIAETQAKDIQLGQPAEIDTRNGSIPGRVIRIDPAVENGTVTVDVALDAPLPKGARPDLSVDGTIELERLENVLYVGRPVQGQPEGTVGLFKLVDGGKTAVRVTVRLGRSSVSVIEIVEGLQAGDQVILSDMSRWDAHERVRLE